MNKACKDSFHKMFRQILSFLKHPASGVLPARSRMIGAAAVILVLILILVLATCSRNVPTDGPAEAAADTLETETESTTEPAVTEPQPVGIPATMGTVTADMLAIYKDAGSDEGIDDQYSRGDRVEIHETKDAVGTRWGYTGKGWICMDNVRMDDVPPDNEDPAGFGLVSNGSRAVLGYGVVDLKELNVRSGPSTDHAKVGEVFQGVRYAYYEEADGWVRINGGWVSTSYFYVEGTTAEDATSGTVTTDDLNVRSGPDTTFQRLTSYMKDDPIQILAVVNGWGYTEKGWISMMYVQLPEPVYTTGNATVTIGLNIREAPDPNSPKVDAYKEGDRITVIEVIDGWGRTDKGWINLDYVKYDE